MKVLFALPFVLSATMSAEASMHGVGGMGNALQLGWRGGTYNGTTGTMGTPETGIANGIDSRLVALGRIDKIDISRTFFLSVAVIPSQAETPIPVLGDFTIALMDTSMAAPIVATTAPAFLAPLTFNAVTDMVYGNPPIETLEANPDGDLGPHGIFDTYYLEIEFEFDDAFKQGFVNVEDDPTTPNLVGGDNNFYFEFLVNVANLSDDVELHFDLYNTVPSSKPGQVGNELIDQKAPFSHDAETYGDVPPPPPPPPPLGDVPEPASLLVWSLMAASVSVGYRRGRRRNDVL